MAPGTRTPNARKPPNEYAGLPRDLNSRLAANTLARLKAVFCLPATTEIAAKHQAKEHRSQAFNAEHSGDLGVATKEPRKGRPAAAGRVLMRIVRCRLPGTLLWHPNLNAYSRYVAPTQPMALGTRTLNKRKLHDVYAGWPRDPDTELAAKNAARPWAVFCQKQLPNRARSPNQRAPEPGI